MRMRMKMTAGALAIGGALAGPAFAQDDAALIKNAEMAAPAAVSTAATIYGMNADGTLRTLREGTNGWWCMPDDPATPSNDPWCGDANALEWANAWASKTEPPAGKVGLMYMLQGGTDSSNTDPYANMEPEGKTWFETGPHLMIANARGLLAGYKGGETPDTTVPYIMWEGTPYEHLMIPTE